MNIMQTNLFAPIYLTRAITRQWLNVPVALSESADVPRGKRDETLDLKKKIILISSISGQIVNRPQCQMAYNASKAGLTMVGKVSSLLSPSLPPPSSAQNKSWFLFLRAGR